MQAILDAFDGEALPVRTTLGYRCGECWTGNFQPGDGSLNTALEHANGQEVLVIAGGQGYVVSPNDRSQRIYFGGWIDHVISVPELQLVIFGDNRGFQAIGPAGTVWHSERPFDGIQNLQQEALIVRGEGWHPPDGGWIRFELNRHAVLAAGPAAELGRCTFFPGGA
jgi:hypothetical protein